MLSPGLMLELMSPYWGVMYPVETVWCRAGGCSYTAVLILAVHRPAGRLHTTRLVTGSAGNSLLSTTEIILVVEKVLK